NGSGQNTNHTYADEGVFTVNLTVNDGDDNGYDDLTVTVNNVAPTANSGGPYSAVINQPIQFNGSAADPGTNDVLTYQWDLDNDGQYDDYTGRYPSRTYTTPGDYPISLRVTDGDGGSDTDDTIVTVSEGVAVTITTSPIEGLSVIVDGETLPSPVTVKKMPGSTISVTALWDHYPGEGIRYHYENWSDGGGRSHTITVPAGPVTITANYSLQYRVDIDTGDKGGNPQGIGWYYPGTQVTISVDSLVLGTQGSTRYRFQSWSGDGIGSYSGSNNPATVTVNQWIIQTVNWEPEYLLQILTTHGSASGGGWYTIGQQVPISIDTLVDEGNGERYRFLSWNGEGTGSYTGSDNPAQVTMYGPVVETVAWQAQYYLDLVTEYGEPTGEDWYDEGQRVTVSIDTTVDAEAGTRVRFLSWQGFGTGSYTGENFTFQVTMHNPITETAQWQTQYYLTLVSEDDRGNPEGEGWYDEGNLVTFTIDSTEAESDVIRHRFVGWEGSGDGSYTGEERSPGIVLMGPVEEVAVWKTQYYISLGINPADGGTVIPFSEPGGWSNAFETLELIAIGNADSGYGSHWSSSGDTVTTANPYAFTVNEPLNLDANFKKGKIIITSVPTGLVLRIDGLEIISPVVYNWPIGSSHTIGALSPQGDDITSHYEFDSWSDFGSQEHAILLEDTAATYTAYFNASFYLSVEPDSGNPVGEGWYGEGTDAFVSVDSLLDDYGGVRYKFAEWIGTGLGSVSSTDREIHVIPQGPVTEESQWTPQFKLNVQTIPTYAPGASIEIDPPGPWYDPNTQVRLQVTITDPSYSFLGWNGDVLTSANPLTITITEPMDIIAKFDTPNFPPWIKGIPEIAMLEDEIFSRSYAWLSQYIKDANDPIEWLTFTFGGQTHLTFEMDSAQQQFKIIPESNWHGREKIGLKVKDPFGLADSDSFYVNVISVNDPPGTFDLISPPQDTSISEWFWPMEFHWEHSANVDTGDAIIYNFYVSPSSSLSGPGTIAVSIGDTAIMMNLQTQGTYYWGVWAEDALREKTLCNEIFRITVFQTDVETEDQRMPTEYSLYQNFPNPFNPYTTIRYGLPKADETELFIFDIQGRMVRRLLQGRMPAGYHEIRWDGRDNYGRQVSSGMYLLIIKAGPFIEQRKMVLLR
ncbi:PKD domain-containing protein, partial [bacterium]